MGNYNYDLSFIKSNWNTADVYKLLYKSNLAVRQPCRALFCATVDLQTPSDE